MTKNKINVKKLCENAKLPTRGSEYAAGYDLYAFLGDYSQCIIEPGQTFKVHTGISMAIPDGFFGAIFARSGLATKKGLRPANCVGVIDSDYRGEVIVALHNDTDEPQSFRNGERIAQLVILPYAAAEFTEVESLDETKRGEGGFGSTGTQAVNNEKAEIDRLKAVINENIEHEKEHLKKCECECRYREQLDSIFSNPGIKTITDQLPQQTWMAYLW